MGVQTVSFLPLPPVAPQAHGVQSMAQTRGAHDEWKMLLLKTVISDSFVTCNQLVQVGTQGWNKTEDTAIKNQNDSFTCIR